MSEDYTLPEGKYVDIEGPYKIHYHEKGEGEPIVFLHGSGPGASGWSNFSGNMDAFVDAGFRVILPDSLGYGYSSKPADAEYTVEFFNAGVKGLMDGLGLKSAYVIGNSLGGGMALNFALSHPERVKKLVLLAPAGLGPAETYLAMPGIRGIIDCMLGEEGPTVEKLRALFKMQLFDESLVTDEIIFSRQKVALTQPANVLATMKVTNVADRLSEITCPVLTFWGMNDKFCPVETADLLARGPKNSRVMLINECGHWVQVEYPHIFNQVATDFLKEA